MHLFGLQPPHDRKLGMQEHTVSQTYSLQQ